MGTGALKQVSTFKYLGSLICDDGKCDTDIRARIGMAKTAFGQIRKIMVNLSINIETRIRVLKAYVWSVLLFGCEAWTISKEMRKRLEATEVWFYRRMLRVPWTARRTNLEILQRAGVRRELMTVIKRSQVGFLGHLLIRSGLEKDCLLGMMQGKIEEEIY